MLKRRLLVVISFAILCLSAAPTRADLSLYVDVEQTTMSYDPIAEHADITLMGDAEVIVSLYAGATSVDNVKIYNDMVVGGGADSVFDAHMNLDFVQAGVENWSATGDLWLTDNTSGNRIEADFVSSNIYIGGTSGNELFIAGSLNPFGTNEAILVDPGSGNPWTFAGEHDSLFDGGQDGWDNQVTVPLWESWDHGSVIVMHYNVGTNSLDTLFGTYSPSGGYINGDIDMTLAPIPAAVVLGLLGLGVAGLKLRKYA